VCYSILLMGVCVLIANRLFEALNLPWLLRFVIKITVGVLSYFCAIWVLARLLLRDDVLPMMPEVVRSRMFAFRRSPKT